MNGPAAKHDERGRRAVGTDSTPSQTFPLRTSLPILVPSPAWLFLCRSFPCHDSGVFLSLRKTLTLHIRGKSTTCVESSGKRWEKPVHFPAIRPLNPGLARISTHLFPLVPASRALHGTPASGPAPQSRLANPSLQYSFTPFRFHPLLLHSNTPFFTFIPPSCHPWLDKGCPTQFFIGEMKIRTRG